MWDIKLIYKELTQTTKQALLTRTKSHLVTLCASVSARKCIFNSTRVASLRSILAL